MAGTAVDQCEINYEAVIAAAIADAYEQGVNAPAAAAAERIAAGADHWLVQRGRALATTVDAAAAVLATARNVYEDERRDIAMDTYTTKFAERVEAMTMTTAAKTRLSVLVAEGASAAKIAAAQATLDEVVATRAKFDEEAAAM